MSELATVFRQFGASYKRKQGKRLLARHRQALSDIMHCRTATMGGRIYHCPTCDETRYSYHSCRNRHCPKCQHNAGQLWLEKQQAMLLPLPYFMLTFTLPQEFRQLARFKPRAIYNLLFRASAEATQQLAQDPRLLGGQIGMIGVLHTWTRDLAFHPHVHYLVPAGAWQREKGRWLAADPRFFLPVKPLAVLFRAKFRDGLRQLGLLDTTTSQPWQKKWVVHAQPVGSGKAALSYLAPYIFRVAIANSRILAVDEAGVTFRYKASATGQTKQMSLSGADFMQRFLHHILPKGFVKVRYYGFFAPGSRHLLKQIRAALGLKRFYKQPAPKSDPPSDVATCPNCGVHMRLLQRLFPLPRLPPERWLTLN